MKLTKPLLVLSLTLSLPLIFGVYQVWPRADKADWQPAVDIAPNGLMEQAAEDFLTEAFTDHLDSLDVMEVMQPGQSAPLYLINARIPSIPIHQNPLCGSSGCMFLGYLDTGEQYENVLNIYLDLHLPPDIPLLDISETLQNGLPQLVVHQLKDGQLLQLTYAVNSGRYEIVNSQYLPLPQ